MYKTTLLLFLFITACQAGSAPKEDLPGYNLESPDALMGLPPILHEISGLTFADSGLIACVQDELGIVFLYSITSRNIIKQIPFGSEGDYEGIAKAGKTIFVLRSDGTLFEIRDFESDEAKVTRFKTDIPSEDNEGLCYDPERNILLIACKERVGKGNGSKNKRYIYGFDVKLKTLIGDPVYTFDISDLKDFAIRSKADVPLKSRNKSGKREPDFRFRPSAITIHPVTKELFVLSSDDKMLFIFDSSGSITKIVKLNPVLFNQPEGIAFTGNRDLFISNEGQDRNATILRYNFRQ